MFFPSINSENIAAATAGTVITHGHATFLGLSINTGTANSVVTVYDGTTTGGELLGTWDASTKSSHFVGRTCRNGILVVMAAANSNITISYI